MNSKINIIPIFCLAFLPYLLLCQDNEPSSSSSGLKPTYENIQAISTTAEENDNSEHTDVVANFIKTIKSDHVRKIIENVSADYIERNKYIPGDEELLHIIRSTLVSLYPNLYKISRSTAPREKTEAEVKDDGIIEKAFLNCREWCSIKYSNSMICTTGNISELEYYSYMGDNDRDWEFIKSYLEDLTPKNPTSYYYINSDLFTALFKVHCIQSGVSVEAFAEKRKDATKIKEFTRADFNRINCREPCTYYPDPDTDED